MFLGGYCYMIICKHCGKKNSSLNFKCKGCGKVLRRQKGLVGTGILVTALAMDVASDLAGILKEAVLADEYKDEDLCEEVEITPDEDEVCEEIVVEDEDECTCDEEADEDECECDEEAEDQIYVASSTASKFHKPGCRWAEKIDEAKKVTYESRDEAIADGKKPCSICDS